MILYYPVNFCLNFQRLIVHNVKYIKNYIFIIYCACEIQAHQIRNPFCFGSKINTATCIGIGSLNNISYAFVEVENVMQRLCVGDIFCEHKVIAIEPNQIILESPSKEKILLRLKNPST
jgi:hypothetical protein